jgi:cyclopropane fatty-acyl-phospholipid synthase-like methyltransferase
MLEHVGKEFMDGFFGAIDRLLDPEGGVMVTQGITIINRVSTHHFPPSSLPQTSPCS